MYNAIDALKEELSNTVDRLKAAPSNEGLKLDCLALIKAINLLEVRAYGFAITTEWGL